jgi:hypothetical protein
MEQYQLLIILNRGWIMTYTITKEKPAYGKENWHLIGVSDLSKTSNWYKTRKEAVYSMELFKSNEGKWIDLPNRGL